MTSQFLHSISEMLFESDAERVMLQQLYHTAYQQIDQSIKQSEETLQTLRTARANAEATHSQLLQKIGSQHITDTTGIITKRIDEEEKNLRELREKKTELSNKIPNVDLSRPPTFDERFITEFAKKFTNIQDMTITLSDAPQSIQALLPQFYKKLLPTLDKKQQEEILSKLASSSIESLRIILTASINTYNTTTDPKEKLESKQLVHMLLFEIIQQRVNAATSMDDPAKNAQQRTQFFTDVVQEVPDVGPSDILDSFDEHCNFNRKTVGNLLYDLDKKLQIDASSHYDNSAQLSYQLREKLRFGRADLRDHVQRYQKNTGRDLFWARNINDLEMFSTTETERMFKDLELARVMRRTQIQQGKYSFKGGEEFVTNVSRFADALNIFSIKFLRENYKERLETLVTQIQQAPQNQKQQLVTQLIEELYDLKVNSGFNTPGAESVLKKNLPRDQIPLNLIRQIFQEIRDKKGIALSEIQGVTGSIPLRGLYSSIILNKEQQNQAESQQVQRALDQCNSNFEIQLPDEGNIQIKFFYTDASADDCKRAIKSQNGFGNTGGTLVMQLLSQNTLNNQNCISHTFEGVSLSEIKANIQNKIDTHPFPDTPQLKLKLAAYKNYIRVIEEKEREMGYQSINDIKLPPNEELVLRKIIEIHNYYRKQPNITPPENLKTIFELIDEGKYTDAIKKSPNINEEYAKIAKVEIANVPEPLRSFVEKAKVVTQSNTERVTKSAKYKNIWTLSLSSDEKIEQLTDLYYSEYAEMSTKVLGFSTPEQLSELKEHAKIMATDLVRLTDRVASGEPILTPNEQTAYFKAISDIQTELNRIGLQLQDATFKIKHSSNGQCIVDAKDNNGQSHTISISLTTQLPYSLIKPMGHNECIFSFGGNRENVAPLADLEHVYGKKTRFFTASRQLGEGQYGAVKLARGILSGVNYAIKKGTTTDAFKESARKNPKLRGRTRLKDPLAKAEYEAQMRIKSAQADESSLDGGFDILYSEIQDKPRPVGDLFQTSEIDEYTLITRVASGSTLADMEQERLNLHSKGEEAYHNPLEDAALTNLDQLLDTLKDELTLAEDVVSKATQFAKHFSHNDIKPENVMAKRMSDGHYKVSFIDWATQGAKEQYTGDKKNLESIFKEKYGLTTLLTKEQNLICDEASGKFVRKNPNGTIEFGVNPRLQVLHGPGYNCTPAYISSAALWRDEEEWKSQAKDEEKDTIINGNDPVMDDLSLTGMIFGICNRKVYFTTLEGRVVNDYTVPGVIGKDSYGNLMIENTDQFNRFFACEDKDSLGVDAIKDFHEKKDAVMYIPSNKRNGSPRHLYRLLKAIKAECDKTPVEPTKAAMSARIDTILTTVHASIENGKGLSKQELIAQFKAARDCIDQANKLFVVHDEITNRKTTVFHETLERSKNKTINDLLTINAPNSVSDLEILCTYPESTEDQLAASKIVGKITPAELNSIFLSDNAPGRNLFRQCISGGQAIVLGKLLPKIEELPPAQFLALVREQGLLHHALQQQLIFHGEKKAISIAQAIMGVLNVSGVNDEEIFKLMMQEYGPGENRLPAPPDLLWSTNAFHIAIRNNNAEQLKAILHFLPQGSAHDSEIKKALHLAALKYRPELFTQILDAYNKKNPDKPFGPSDILAIQSPPDNTSPYHLFLRQPATVDKIPLQNFSTDDARAFLLTPPTYPCLVAAGHGNEKGIDALFTIANQLSDENKLSLLTKTDAHGKNLLNYFLEHPQLGGIDKLIQHVQTLCPQNNTDVIRHLLMNPHPANPIRNFLAASNDPRIALRTLTQLLDTACASTSASEEQQKSRLIVLLVNQDWFIQQAADLANHDNLRTLLRSPSLSIPNQQVLFKLLLERCASNPNATATTLFTTLRNEVMLGSPKEIREHIVLQIPDVLKEVALQRNDLGEFLRLVAGDEQKLIKEFKDHVEKLTKELRSAQAKMTEQTLAAETAKKEADRLTKQLSTQEDQFELAKKKLTAAFNSDFQEAQERGASAFKAVRENLEREITELTKRHEIERNAYAQALSQSIQEVDQFRRSAEDYQVLWQKVTEDYKKLTFENKELISSQEEAQRINIDLSKRIHETEVAGNKLSQTVSELQRINKQLSNKILTLEEKVNQLTAQVSHTESQLAEKSSRIDQLSEENTAVRDQLKELTTKEIGTRNELQRTTSDLEKSTKEVLQLRRKITTIEEKYTESRLLLEREIAAAHEGNEQHVASLRKQLEEGESIYAAELDKLEQSITDKTKKIEELDRTIQQQSEDLATKNREIDELSSRIKTAFAENEALRTSKELNQSQRSILERQQDQMQETRSALETLKQEHNEAIGRLQSEVDRVSLNLLDENQTNQRLLVTLEADIKHLEERFRGVNDNFGNMNIWVSENPRRLETYRSELLTAQSTAEQLKKDIELLNTGHNQKISEIKRQIEEHKPSREIQVNLRSLLTRQLEQEQREYETNKVRLINELDQSTQQITEINKTINKQQLDITQIQVATVAFQQAFTDIIEGNARIMKKFSTKNLGYNQEQIDRLGRDAQSALTYIEQELNPSIEKFVSTNAELQAQSDAVTIINTQSLRELASFSRQIEQLTLLITQLSTQLDTKETEARDAQIGLEEAQNALAMSQDRERVIAQKIETMTAEYRKEIELLKETMQRTGLVQQEMASRLEIREQQFIHTLHPLHNELQNLRTYTQELLDTISTQSASITNSQHEIARLNTEQQRLLDENIRLKNELESSKKEHGKDSTRYTDALKKQQITIRKTESRIKKLQTSFTSLSTKHAGLRKKVRGITADNTRLKATTEELQKQLSTLQTQLNAKTDEVNHLTAQQATTQQVMQTTREEAARLRDEMTTLEQTHQQKIAELTTALATAKENNLSIDQLTQEIQSAEKQHTLQMGGLEQRYQDAVKDKDRLEAMLQKQQKELTKNLHQQSRLSDTIRSLERENARLRAKIQRLKTTHHHKSLAMQRQLDNQRLEIERLQQANTALTDAITVKAERPLPEPPLVVEGAEKSAPTQKSEKKATESLPMMIFASLTAIDRTSLFKPDSPVITINYSSEELKPEQLSELKSHGLNVHSPSGQQFNLSIINHVPKAVMTQDDAKAAEGEDDAQYKQRLAVTIMTMIDNVLAQSDRVEIKTEDPFIAAVSRKYIAHLQKIPQFANTDFKIETKTEDQDGASEKKADNIVKTLRPQIEQHLNPNVENTNRKNFISWKKQYKASIHQASSIDDTADNKPPSIP